ncbi:uncharacterized protein VP01_3367g5 [Puccinia sorghi]|uniref:Uncharacterized protein n=1 Tax=Puccinia sorghi TaxID=27349 RepID=A0A0L6UWW9_9BASI|nr:uncharacterized protein VP01_3367g5 [Puccinia sorghi]
MCPQPLLAHRLPPTCPLQARPRETWITNQRQGSGTTHLGQGEDPTAGSGTTSSGSPQNMSISFIKDNPLRAELHTILKNFQGNLNRQKFKQAHLAVHTFIDSQAKTIDKRTPPTTLPHFRLNQSEASHSAWVKDIQNSTRLIGLSVGELWCAPGWIEIEKLKSENPPGLKSNAHVEYPLLTAPEFSHKPPSLTNLSEDNLGSHLQILEYLNSCKTGSHEEDGKICKNMTLKPLYLQALVLQKTQLEKYCLRHNYTPFCLYLVAGVCGLILATNNQQFSSGPLALGFLSAVEHIFKKNQPQREGLEPIWKRLGAYIDRLFIDSFLTPNCLLNFCQPQIIQLAQAITADFLFCLEKQFPAKQFQLPWPITAK